MEIPSDFCPHCGNLLDMPLYGNFIECMNCQSKIDIAEFISKPIVTVIEFNDKKPWLEKYRERHDLQEKDQEQSNKATIKQECPNCSNKQMYFWTVQIRSVDEGSTVFYQCPKCDYTFTQNN